MFSKNNELSKRNGKYELLLAAVIAVRATSFIFSKIILESMQTFNLLAVRFILAFLLMGLLFFRRIIKIKKKELISGVIIGVLFYAVLGSELTALKTADSSMVSMIENCAIVLVPLFEIPFTRKRPDKMIMLCAFIALAGVFCLSAQADTLSIGMIFAFITAVLYAIGIIATSRLSEGAENTLGIGIIQVGTIGFLSLATSFIFETPKFPDNTNQWLMIVLLAVVCTGFGFTLQPVAQSRIPADRAGLFCAISPAISAILGAVVLKEKFGIFSAIGLMLILLSITLPYIHPKKHNRTEQAQAV